MKEIDFLCINQLCYEKLSGPRPVRFDIQKAKTSKDLICKDCQKSIALTGSENNKYYLLEHIGRGSYGKVFKACKFDHNSLHFYAIKFLEIGPDNSSIFEREKKSLNEANKAGVNVPKYIDSCITPPITTDKLNNQIFLVLEYIEGQTLEQYLLERIKRKDYFKEKEVIAILIEILKNLHLLQRELPEFIHRDLKLSNIMRKQGNEIYIIDLGSAKTETSRYTQPAPTSCSYAGPELLDITISDEILNQYRKTIDLHSVAVICFCLINGETAEKRKLRHDKPRSPEWQRWTNEANRRASNISEILKRMSCYDATDRYQSAGEALLAASTVAWKIYQEERDEWLLNDRLLKTIETCINDGEINPTNDEKNFLKESRDFLEKKERRKNLIYLKKKTELVLLIVSNLD